MIAWTIGVLSSLRCSTQLMFRFVCD